MHCPVAARAPQPSFDANPGHYKYDIELAVRQTAQIAIIHMNVLWRPSRQRRHLRDAFATSTKRERTGLQKKQLCKMSYLSSSSLEEIRLIHTRPPATEQLRSDLPDHEAVSAK